MTEPLRLTDQERSLLAGEAGPGMQKAMEIVVALGQIYGARDLTPVASVQVAGVSFKNLGEAGLEFLEEWSAQGAHAQVPATLNPAGLDLESWRDLGFSEAFAHSQQRVIEAYIALGVTPICTCTPYLVGYRPEFGQHLAWAESSAVSFANSLLGARTNREGGPSALAAAISGRTARYGLHLDENRLGTALIDVRAAISSEADLGALGYQVGRLVKNGVPYFRFRQTPQTDWEWKALGAAMAASGAVALFHIEGITPEAVQTDMLAKGAPTHAIDSLQEGYQALNGPVETIDLVSLGCPHASLAELQAVADYLEGKRVHSALWITTARATRQAAQAAGLVARIEAAGGRVVADTCLVVAPVHELGFRTMATNSAKMATYAPAHSGLVVRFGPMPQCLDAALAGRWTAKPEGGD